MAPFRSSRSAEDRLEGGPAWPPRTRGAPQRRGRMRVPTPTGCRVKQDAEGWPRVPSPAPAGVELSGFSRKRAIFAETPLQRTTLMLPKPLIYCHLSNADPGSNPRLRLGTPETVPGAVAGNHAVTVIREASGMVANLRGAWAREAKLSTPNAQLSTLK